MLNYQRVVGIQQVQGWDSMGISGSFIQPPKKGHVPRPTLW